MEAKKKLLTYAGLKALEEELENLKVVKRKEVAAKIKEAASEDAQCKAEGIQIVSISARLNGLQKRQKKLAEKC